MFCSRESFKGLSQHLIKHEPLVKASCFLCINHSFCGLRYAKRPSLCYSLGTGCFLKCLQISLTKERAAKIGFKSISYQQNNLWVLFSLTLRILSELIK